MSKTKLLSKESVGKVALAITISSTAYLGAVLHDKNQILEATVERLGEAQIRIVQNQNDYKSLEQKFLSVESESKKLSKRQGELKSQLNKMKADKIHLAEENKSLEVKLRQKQLREAREKAIAETAKKESQVKPNSRTTAHVVTAKATSTSSSNGYKGWRKLSVTSTGYSTYENGDKLSGRKWGGKTKTGTTPRWGTIAVDPNVIPLGSKVYIPKFNMTFTAEDTGSAIIGNKVDIFFDSVSQANKWGRQHNVEVYVK